jgi:hypothetical protein
MIGVINRLKAELKIQEAYAEVVKEKVYDITSKEHYNHQLESIEDFKKAIKILEDAKDAI